MLDYIAHHWSARLRQCLDLLSRALLGVATRERRGRNSMLIGAQFSATMTQPRDGIQQGLALVQLRRLDLDRFEAGANSIRLLVVARAFHVFHEFPRANLCGVEEFLLQILA